MSVDAPDPSTSALVSEDPMPLRRCGQSDLKDIVDGMLAIPPSASLGRIRTSRLSRQVKPKLAEDIDDPDDEYVQLDSRCGQG